MEIYIQHGRRNNIDMQCPVVIDDLIYYFSEIYIEREVNKDATNDIDIENIFTLSQYEFKLFSVNINGSGPRQLEAFSSTTLPFEDIYGRTYRIKTALPIDESSMFVVESGDFSYVDESKSIIRAIDLKKGIDLYSADLSKIIEKYSTFSADYIAATQNGGFVLASQVWNDDDHQLIVTCVFDTNGKAIGMSELDISHTYSCLLGMTTMQR